jgi:imidazolonepropionase-like amidohydrolase
LVSRPSAPGIFGRLIALLEQAWRVKCFLFVLFGCSASGLLQGQPSITLRAARVLDGRGRTIERGVVEVLKGRIVAVDQRAGPVSYDFGDGTLLPGLIDVHVHITYTRATVTEPGAPAPLATEDPDEILANARATLMAGFTTVQSLGAHQDIALRDAIAAGVIVGPRLLTSTRQIQGLTRSPEELRAIVRQTKADGADVIKFFTSGVFLKGGQLNVTQEQVNAVCDEARAVGLRCVVHAHSSDAIVAAVRAGCASIEHGFFADDKAIAAMKAANVFFDPNIGLALQLYLENRARLLAAGRFSEADFAKMEAALPHLNEVFRKALAAGLRMPMGTDVTGGGHGMNAREIIARVGQGQSTMDAIIGATSLAAESLDEQASIGAIAPGYSADIIAVAGNPLSHIAELQHVQFVMKEGEVYKRPAATK